MSVEGDRNPDCDVQGSLAEARSIRLSPLDLLPHEDLREKLVELVVSGVPRGIPASSATVLQHIKDELCRGHVSDLQVVVFGGGTGLSTIIGGDSRAVSWPSDPFSGLKSVFPKTSAIVCVTDDGGSTGELLKDLPIIALGDIRHVLLSSIQSARLQDFYNLNEAEAVKCAGGIASVFNYRFQHCPGSPEQLINDSGLNAHDDFPPVISAILRRGIENLFDDPRLKVTLNKPHCLGNLLLASSIYEQIPHYLTNEDLIKEREILRQNLHRGISSLSVVLGADEQAVIPCVTVPAELSVRYTNGVQVTGEHKSGEARRNCPVEYISVNFSEEPSLSGNIRKLIESADIMIMAPGSLYTSLIPIFQVPGIVEAVKKNNRALKILVSNLWVQAGETDLSIAEPDRKFHLSDLLRAYEYNIPWGTEGLFDTVLCLSFKDVPATVIQSYAVEGKVPIYLDREKVKEHGVIPLECSIYSRAALRDIGVIRHDPRQFAIVIQTLWAAYVHLRTGSKASPYIGSGKAWNDKHMSNMTIPCVRYSAIEKKLAAIDVQLDDKIGTEGKSALEVIRRILWDHKDISLEHMRFVKGVRCIASEEWKRNQNWDRVYSFYDPHDSFIKIRQDQFDQEHTFEVAFLVALGQSLLGNYFREKRILLVDSEHPQLGKAYHLYLRKNEDRHCYFREQDLTAFLELARMVPDPGDPEHFTRLINGNEGFTPPGLLFGLTYAWYLDNRFASNIEYKMAVLRIDRSDLIPEQVRMRTRREKVTDFFRRVVFCH